MLIDQKNSPIVSNPSLIVSNSATRLKNLPKAYGPGKKLKLLTNVCKTLCENVRKYSNKIAGADILLPLLIYTILKARPDNLISNLNILYKFGHESQIEMNEGAFFLEQFKFASVMIMKIDAKFLNLTQEVFNDYCTNCLLKKI